eukprot:5560517-Lingulodinium_polyedra.AAC.1
MAWSNITKEDDFTKRCTVDTVAGLLQGPKDVLFYCSPCAGASFWQHVNLAKGKARGCDDI